MCTLGSSCSCSRAQPTRRRRRNCVHQFRIAINRCGPQGCGTARPTPSWRRRLAVAVGVAATQCVAMLVLSAQLHTSAVLCTCHAVLLWARRLRACDMRRLYACTEQSAVVVLCMCTLRCRRYHVSRLQVSRRRVGSLPTPQRRRSLFHLSCRRLR